MKRFRTVAKKGSNNRAKITRLHAQTKAIRAVNGLALCLFGLSVGAVVVASAMPQKRQLEAKHEELDAVLEKERKVIARKEDARASQEALRSDPEYLELHARDRLNLYREGETIYRIERDR